MPRSTRLNCTTLQDRTVPATIHVNSLLDTTPAGDRQVTLREAILAANTDTPTDLGDAGSGNDTIVFVDAATGGTVTLTTGAVPLQFGLPIITSNITIKGTQNTRESITRNTSTSSDDFCLFNVASGGSLTLSDLIVTNSGSTDQNGSAQVQSGGALTAKRTTFTGNTTRLNGGVIANQGLLTLDQVDFTNNFSRLNGGALYNDSGATANISNSLFANNEAGDGGAIYNKGTLTMVNTTVGNNKAVRTAGIFTTGPVTLLNVTIAANNSSTADYAAGLHMVGFFNGLGVVYPTVYMSNTLVGINIVGANANSTGTLFDISGIVYGNHNLVSDGLNSGGMSVSDGNSNLVGVNPKLGGLVNNGGPTRTFAIDVSSPALNAGSDIYTVPYNGNTQGNTLPVYAPYDQRGVRRDAVGPVQPDIGAYEVQNPLSPVGTPNNFVQMYSPKPSANANEAFVKGLYQTTLLRAPDLAGLNGWINQLAVGVSRSTVALGFINSIENRSSQVRFFYRYFLNREPDTAGLNFWVDRLRGGADEVTVMSGFVLSPEFSATANNTAFVNLLYGTILGRKADSAGFNGWVNALNTGTGRDAVLRAFVRSDEGMGRVAKSYYLNYLLRDGNDPEIASTVNFLRTNTFGVTAASILASQEFYVNASANI